MAKTISEFTIKARGRTPTHPWDEWLDGQIHELRKGEDFKSEPESLRSAASGQARKRGGGIETRLDKEKGVLQLRFVANGKKTAKKSAAKK